MSGRSSVPDTAAAPEPTPAATTGSATSGLAGEAALAPWVRTCLWLTHYTAQTCPWLGTGEFARMRHSINLTKGATLVVAFLLMVVYGNTDVPGAWLYVALHGSYSVLWVAKDCCFPDPRWDVPQTKAGFVNVVVVLMGYWLAPWYLNATHFAASNFRLFVAVFVYVLGVALMLGSDCQKYYQLRYRRGLIVDGFFRYTRNPNYVGEMMLYTSFALLAGAWAPYAYLLLIWTVMFYPNMCRKDASLCRYPEFAAYAQHSGMLVPDFAAIQRDVKALLAGAGKSA